MIFSYLSLENELSPIPLKFSPWMSWTSYPLTLKQHPLINTTLSIFHLLNKQSELSTPLSPLTSLKNNPNFPPGMGNHLLQSSDPDIPLLTKHFFQNALIKDFHALKLDNHIPHLPLWTYFQIRYYANNMCGKGRFTRQLSELESVCLEDDQIQKATSISYTWLQNSNQPPMDRFRESWSKDLAMVLTDRQWQRDCIFAHKCSLSTRMQETAVKILTQWYATPAKLHKWCLQTSELCWRCQKDEGTPLHIWWQCPLICPYWTEVKRIIRHITETTLKLDVACCLLHVTNFLVQKYKNSLSKHLLNAAKSLIPLFWKSASTPSIRDWLHRITDICDMEETTAQSNDTIELYHKTWSPLFAFKYSQEYENLRLVLSD